MARDSITFTSKAGDDWACAQPGAELTTKARSAGAGLPEGQVLEGHAKLRANAAWVDAEHAVAVAHYTLDFYLIGESTLLAVAETAEAARAAVERRDTLQITEAPLVQLPFAAPWWRGLEHKPGTLEIQACAEALTGGVTHDFVEEAGGLIRFAENCAAGGCHCEPCDVHADHPDGHGSSCNDYRCLACEAADLIAAVRRPTNEAARAVIRDFLEGEHADVRIQLVEHGPSSWAWWLYPDDTTSYVHEDLKIEWHGHVPPEEPDNA